MVGEEISILNCEYCGKGIWQGNPFYVCQEEECNENKSIYCKDCVKRCDECKKFFCEDHHDDHKEDCKKDEE